VLIHCFVNQIANMASEDPTHAQRDTPPSAPATLPTLQATEEPLELWRHADPSSTQMHAFRELINCKYGLQLDHYEDLHKWSVEHLNEFWSECWDFVGIRGDKGTGEVCEPSHAAIHV
jgi:hypothetical protein